MTATKPPDMQADPNNPFAAASVPTPAPENGSGAPSPFQIAEPGPPAQPWVGPSPFAGVGNDSPFRLAESTSDRPAQLPERRFSGSTKGYEEAVTEQKGGAGDGFACPFEQVTAADPFEPVFGGPTEGFLPDQEESAAAPELPVREDPVQNGINGEVFAPVSPPPEPTGFLAMDGPEVLYRNEPQEISSIPGAAPAGLSPLAAAAETASSVAHAGTPQLVLRAVFGVTHELNANEMLQHALHLPGVRKLAVVGLDEARAMQVLREKVSQLGFGEQHSITLSSRDGDVDIIEEEGTTLAVLHESGGYAPGVRETLIIVTRELAHLRD